MEKIRLAILGATGMAGREALLHQEELDQQYAEITCVTASPASAGKKLGDVFSDKEWNLHYHYPFWQTRICPNGTYSMIIDETDADIIAEKADYAISALESDIAKELEPELNKRGVHVFSNSSAYRWSPKVPLLIPEVNYQDLKLVEQQDTHGKLVCNPNCTTAGYVPLIKALEDYGYTIKEIDLVTQQAMSGKGDAISSRDYLESIEGNVKDDWADNTGYNAEEWKSACEPMKILGRVKTKEEVLEEREKILNGQPSKLIPIHTQTTRVNVAHGHLEYLFLDFQQEVKIKDIKEQLKGYRLPEEIEFLPSTPYPFFAVFNRMPEPSEDVYTGQGMSVVVGDFKQHTPNKISLWSLTHNLRRGATWAGRQGLELYLQNYKGLFQ